MNSQIAGFAFVAISVLSDRLVAQSQAKHSLIESELASTVVVASSDLG